MTRAKERLIVSGSIDREKKADASTPIGWVLDAPRRRRGARTRRRRAGRDRARRRAPRSCASTATRERTGPSAAETGRADEAGQLALFAALEEAATAPRRRSCRRSSRRRSRRCIASRRLSFTALSTFEQCSYKYYAMLRRRDAGAAARSSGGRRRAARDGDRRRRAPAARAGRPRRAGGARRRAGARVVPDGRATRSSSASARSSRRTATRSSRARVAALAARRRRSGTFTFEHDGVLLHGFVDALAPRGRRVRSSSTTRRT